MSNGVKEIREKAGDDILAEITATNLEMQRLQKYLSDLQEKLNAKLGPISGSLPREPRIKKR